MEIGILKFRKEVAHWFNVIFVLSLAQFAFFAALQTFILIKSRTLTSPRYIYQMVSCMYVASLGFLVCGLNNQLWWHGHISIHTWYRLVGLSCYLLCAVLVQDWFIIYRYLKTAF